MKARLSIKTLTASLLLAFATSFTLTACGGDNDSGDGDTSSSSVEAVHNSSSSSGGGNLSSGGGSSSSSSGTQSSSSGEIERGSVSYGGKSYETVKIGEQWWMAENLDYDAPGSECYYIPCLSEEPCGPLPPNYYCETYGRLYDWETAMGICPGGWHLPSDAEWDALMSFIHTDNSLASFSSGTSDYAGKYLKATSRWYDNGNGTDAYGFAALPGGYGNSVGNFLGIGSYGIWWSSSEYSAKSTCNRNMGYRYEGAHWNYGDKTFLFSVRCVQD